VEVGPRDGLQNEAAILSTEDKVAFIEMLARSGLQDIEVSSFVNPARVPQLADADAVFARLTRPADVRFTALVANERGLDRALAAGVDGIALFTAASEAFALRNIGKSVEESLALFRRLAIRAKAAGIRVRAYISTAFACPFSGPVTPAAVVPVAAELLDMGCSEISVADTIGSARPEQVNRLTEALLPVLPLERFAYHFHDTGGAALANVDAALAAGVAIFDSSAGGLGGCPFAPGAPGNLATEDLLGLLADRGIASGVDVEQIRSATRMVRALLASVDKPSRLC
jgi:isopropylmalate/homocitrate/citramalate synthase